MHRLLALSLMVGASGALAQDGPLAPTPPRLPLADAPATAARGEGGETVAPVARWPYGYVRAVAFAGEVPVAAHGSVVQTLALEASGELTVRGEVVLGGVVNDMAAEGDLVAAVVTHFERDETGLVVVDVSDPDAPCVRGRVPGLSSTGVALRGGLAYVSTYEVDGASAFTLRVISLADPDAPQELGWTQTDSFAEDLAVVRDRVYLALNVAGLAVVDVASPEAPVLAATPSQDYTSAVAVREGRLATVQRTASGEARLRLFALDDPDAPVLLGAADLLGDRIDFGPIPMDLAWDRNRIAIATGFGGLQHADVSDPAAPVVEAQTATNAAFVADGASRVAAHGSDLLVADVYGGAVRVRMPERAVSGRLLDGGVALDVAVDPASGRVYVADGGAGLMVLDAAAGVITPVARVHGSEWNYASGVAQTDAHVYVADGFAGVWVVEKGTLSVVGNVARGTSTRRVRTGDGLLTTVDDASTIRVYSLTDPVAPALQTTLVSPEGGTDALLRGGALWVGAGNSSNLRVYDAAEPASPVLAEEVPLTGFGFRLAADGDRLYALGNGLVANVLDASAPLAPSVLGTVTSVVRQEALAAEEDVLVMVGFEVAAYGMADPEAPRQLGASAAFGDVQSGAAFVAPRLAAVAANHAGVYLVATPPAVAVEVGGPLAGLRLAAAPNPSGGAPAVTVGTSAPEAVAVEVFDALGRRVHAWDAVAASGETRLTWDAAPLAPGVYVVRARAASGETAALRVTVAR